MIGCDVIYSEYDVMNEVIVLSYSACHVIYNGYDFMDYSGCDLRNIVGVIESVQWM